MARTQKKSRTPVLDRCQLILVRRDGPQKSRISPRGQYWIFHWYDVDSGQYYRTHVDTDMVNFAAWRELCWRRDYYGVYEGLGLPPRQRTDYATPVISADGRPECWLPLTRDQCFDVAELDINERTAPNTYGKLYA